VYSSKTKLELDAFPIRGILRGHLPLERRPVQEREAPDVFREAGQMHHSKGGSSAS